VTRFSFILIKIFFNKVGFLIFIIKLFANDLLHFHKFFYSLLHLKVFNLLLKLTGNLAKNSIKNRNNYKVKSQINLKHDALKLFFIRCQMAFFFFFYFYIPIIFYLYFFLFFFFFFFFFFNG